LNAEAATPPLASAAPVEWVDADPEFVDQIAVEQGLTEPAVPVDHEVSAVLLFELADGGYRVLTDDR
jgi:hypothetical protein